MTDDLNKLSHEELNRRLAELVGWVFNKVPGYLAILGPDGHYQGGASDYDPDQLKTAMGNARVPSYSTSLDACAVVEAGLTENQRGEFIDKLCNICRAQNDGPGTAISKAFFATATQRTIALIRCLESK